MENRDVFGQARLEAILIANHEAEGMAPAEILDQVARKAELKAIEDMGEESENRFSVYARRLPIVKSVRNPTPEEDVYRGIDKWILFTENQGLPELPVQVKSSYHDAKRYKYGDPNTGRRPDPCFTRLHGMQIVLNCGRSVKPGTFRKQLHEEMRRIRLTLKGNPSLTKYIQR